ncbi:LysE family translocator [Aureispira anguillae]|uniref:LysE family translocator n=1 Tax=Aureispira anguillae TaxID=2864201 RepID=A0A915YFX9_9BACT|nr:LysE family translocator [Aureispira anguillae]BDS12422.1 LysE family translocator [Aureispira anguillae]
MELELLISFLGASIILSLMPGPDNLFVLTESLTKGQKNGIAISIGLSLGVLVHTLAAATGVSIIIQQSALAFSVLKYLGAAYLFYLAFMAIREKPLTLDLKNDAVTVQRPTIALIKKGFFMNVLNPKVSLFFIAFLPQFVSHTGFAVTLQMIILGLLFMVQALVVFSLIAMLSSQLTSYVNSPKFWGITKWSKITVLSLLGLTLAFSKK